MQKTIHSKLIAASLVMACAPSFAQSAIPSWDEYQDVRAKGISVWQLNIENDSLLFNGRDGFYTSGVQLGQRNVWNTQSNSTTYGWRIGQELYTASDTKLLPWQLSPRDHPYAGWLFGGIYKESADASGRSIRLGLDVGCLGPCAAGDWSQTHLHRLLHQPLPQGWSTQLGNEWGAVLYGEWSPLRWAPAAFLDITPTVKGRFGNIFTDAAVGLTVRAGALNRLPEQPANYAFFRAEAKAVAYNATIQGGYFADEHTGVDPKKSVGELEAGYVWRGERLGVNVSIVRRSNEIRQLTNGEGAQNFAKILFFYAM
ncbi:lipid A deacylase LpxR family protein [Undibacterium sp.]|jgi:lipid A 3-O-deacylase|uniref:lipid A deacylase LpxR family protein n=1 Tax=Undibacterium sp. TaxID=1914977 RepID=UPI002B6B76CB|nr:lipid A deacylase LpxR family protein [Undibacterium sp.]HTD07223.1 lipid A deacylase LpxR family protein [Undibacterium sp.]